MRTGGYNGRRKGGCSLENRGTVRSVAKAMELLQLLSERGEPLSLTEIARMQELPKSTAFGLLNTLREYEMVSQGRDGRYSLGIRLFEYGCRVSRAWDVPRLARPYLEQLAAQLLASLEQVRRQGYAVEDGEYKIGLRSVSAPVYGVDGAVRCTVGIVGMLRSTHSEEFRRAVEQVTAAGRMLSAALGYTGE